VPVPVVRQALLLPYSPIYLQLLAAAACCCCCCLPATPRPARPRSSENMKHAPFHCGHARCPMPDGLPIGPRPLHVTCLPYTTDTRRTLESPSDEVRCVSPWVPRAQYTGARAGSHRDRPRVEVHSPQSKTKIPPSGPGERTRAVVPSRNRYIDSSWFLVLLAPSSSRPPVGAQYS
jgi:hypothetical protein